MLFVYSFINIELFEDCRRGLSGGLLGGYQGKECVKGYCQRLSKSLIGYRQRLSKSLIG